MFELIFADLSFCTPIQHHPDARSRYTSKEGRALPSESLQHNDDSAHQKYSLPVPQEWDRLASTMSRPGKEHPYVYSNMNMYTCVLGKGKKEEKKGRKGKEKLEAPRSQWPGEGRIENGYFCEPELVPSSVPGVLLSVVLEWCLPGNATSYAPGPLGCWSIAPERRKTQCRGREEPGKSSPGPSHWGLKAERKFVFK